MGIAPPEGLLGGDSSRAPVPWLLGPSLDISVIGEPLTSPDRFPHCLPDLTIIKHFLLFSLMFFFLNFRPLVLVLPKFTTENDSASSLPLA